MNIKNLKLCKRNIQNRYIYYKDTRIIFDGDDYSRNPRDLSPNSLMIDDKDRRGMDYA